MKTIIMQHAVLTATVCATLSLSGCDKSSPSPTNSTPPSPPKTSSNTAAPSASETVANAQQAATDAIASGQAAIAGTLQDLGVTLPSFDELRAKAGQSITPANADTEFERLQLEVASEGG